MSFTLLPICKKNACQQTHKLILVIKTIFMNRFQKKEVLIMAVEEDVVTTIEENAIMEVKDAVASTKKENMSEIKADNARENAIKDVKLAVSKYIEELREKVGSLAEIAKKLDNIESQIQKNTMNLNFSFERSLRQWLNKKGELSLYHLCLLTQVNHDSYDYILGLDKKISADQLTYGDTLDFFSYLFRTGKIEVLRCEKDDLFTPASTVASKDGFDMTRFFRFTDETLCSVFEELYYQKQTDLQNRIGDKEKDTYKRALQQFISKYENIPLVSESCGIGTDEHASSLPNNGQNKPSQRIYHGLPDDLLDRIKSLPKKYGKKTQKEFAEDAGIAQSTFSGWLKKRKDSLNESYPTSSSLYLMAKTYGFSVDSFLRTDASDKNEKKHPCEYTYGNTLRFIDQLQTAGVVFAVPSWKYATSSANRTPRHTKNPDGKNPNNMNYSCDGEPAYLSGIFFIRDDFLIRLITEIEAKMSRPFDAPQKLDTAQIGYDMSQQSVKEFIARYDSENLLCYQKGIREALGKCSEKWRKYYYGYNDPWAFTLDMSVDLDEMLEELRVAEKEAFKALQNGNTRKQET